MFTYFKIEKAPINYNVSEKRSLFHSNVMDPYAMLYSVYSDTYLLTDSHYLRQIERVTCFFSKHYLRITIQHVPSFVVQFVHLFNFSSSCRNFIRNDLFRLSQNPPSDRWPGLVPGTPDFKRCIRISGGGLGLSARHHFHRNPGRN